MSQYPWHRYDFWTPTFLMASGDDAALELARRHLCADLKDQYPEAHGGRTWTFSYRLINLCEYYLLLGDSSVLPAIRYYAQALAWAQYRSGSWSHGGGEGLLAPGTASGGYGEINCAGLGAFIGLCLARQCGLEPYDHTLPRAIRFGKFCGSSFPYGLGTPSERGGRMDNGMNAMAAIGFHLLGEDGMAKRWARTVCYMWMGRERGHAEGIFSAAWGPLGAALAPREEFHTFMNHMRWAYELGRTRHGALTFMRGSRWTSPNMTAAVGLFLWLPEHRLQILGGDSVFAHPPPKDLEKATRLYKEKKWKELRELLTAYIERARKPGTLAAENLAYARKLLAAYQRLEEPAAATLRIIEENIQKGMLSTAKLQLDLLARLFGEERPAAARHHRAQAIHQGEPPSSGPGALLEEVQHRIPPQPAVASSGARRAVARGGDGCRAGRGAAAEDEERDVVLLRDGLVAGREDIGEDSLAKFLGGAMVVLAVNGDETLAAVGLALSHERIGRAISVGHDRPVARRQFQRHGLRLARDEYPPGESALAVRTLDGLAAGAD